MAAVSPRDASALLEDDRRIVADVLVKLARRVTELRGGSERAAGDPTSGPPSGPPSGPIDLAPLDPASPVMALATRAELGREELEVLRYLLAAETHVFAYRALQRLGQESPRPGIEIQSLVVAAGYLGHRAERVLAALDPDGILVTRGLVQVARDAGPLLVQRVALPAGLIAGLCGVPGNATRTGARREPALAADRVVAADGVIARARHMLGHRGLWLIGARGVGRRTLLAALCAERGHGLVCVDYRDLVARPLDDVVPMLWRESLLADAVIAIANVGEQPGDPPGAAARLYSAIYTSGVPFVVTSEVAPGLGEFELAPLTLSIANPDARARATLWRAALPRCERLDEIAARFRLPPGRIVRAAAAARETAAAAEREVSLLDVTQAVSAEIAQKVTTLGTRIEATQRWDDLVLPPATLDAMREIVSRAHRRHQVLHDWGFERKLTKGLGLSALFSGPPGTGKTMVAGIIARELSLDLYQIDLSRVVSKYIGETEKNLAEVFDGADWGNVLLLFDEADALFSKRTDVKSSNDRFSNMEVNYLLSRLERFEGVAILTTNLATSIDPAFKRRFTFRVEFATPDAAERAVLWQRMLPPEADLDEWLDYQALADEYELTGGNIRNALLRAAFLAAGEQRGITMSHVVRAVALEYRDAGQISIGGRLNQ